jgi:type II secretory pathway component GspD/PulD (secretin)
MNLRYLVRLGLAALLGAVFNAAFAQQALEIIPLRHRTVDQVLPALQPLLEPGATLSGTRGQLFLRASAPNAEDIKRALAAIDRPAKRLQISVRVDDAFERERRSVEASGSIGSGGARVGVSAQDSRRTAAERVDQRLQVLEGSRATIFAGRSNDYQDAGSGFEVVPRLAGSGVTLEIVQQRPHQAASSTINARLGEWVELAGISQSTARDDRGIASASGRRTSESRRVWVKVEALD